MTIWCGLPPETAAVGHGTHVTFALIGANGRSLSKFLLCRLQIHYADVTGHDIQAVLADQGAVVPNPSVVAPAGMLLDIVKSQFPMTDAPEGEFVEGLTPKLAEIASRPLGHVVHKRAK